MKPNYNFPLKKHKIPEGFVENLQDFIKEILRNQPSDIVEFGYAYFDAKCSGQNFEYNGQPTSQRCRSEKSLNSNTTHKSEKRASLVFMKDLYGNILEPSESGMDSNQQDLSERQNSGSEMRSNSSHMMKFVGELEINIIQAIDLPIEEEDQELECYALIFISNDPMKIVKTDNVEGNNPQWNFRESLYVDTDSGELKELELVIQVYDCAYTKALIGEISIPLYEIITNTHQYNELELDLLHPDFDDQPMGKIAFELRFLNDDYKEDIE